MPRKYFWEIFHLVTMTKLYKNFMLVYHGQNCNMFQFQKNMFQFHSNFYFFKKIPFKLFLASANLLQ